MAVNESFDEILILAYNKCQTNNKVSLDTHYCSYAHIINWISICVFYKRSEAPYFDTDGDLHGKTDVLCPYTAS